MVADPVLLGTAMRDLTEAIRSLDRTCHSVAFDGDYADPRSVELTRVGTLLTTANDALVVALANLEA